MTDTTTANDAGKDTKTATANVTDTAKTDNADKGEAQFDPSKISDDQFAKVFEDPRLFQHSRFKELNEKAKKATEYEKQQADAEKQKLAEKGKFEELLAIERKEKEELQGKYQQATLDGAIRDAAIKAGTVDPQAVLKLIDRSNIQIGADGKLSGVDEAVAALLATSQYLKGKPNANLAIGSGTAPGADENRVTTVRLSDIKNMTPKEFAKNEKTIMFAVRNGKALDDVGQSMGGPTK